MSRTRSKKLTIYRADGTVEHTTTERHLQDIGYLAKPELKKKRGKTSQRRGIPAATRRQVYHRDRHRCRYCYADLTTLEWHIDHVIPRSQGGTNVEANLVASCPTCNQGKGARTANPLPIWDGTYRRLGTTR